MSSTKTLLIGLIVAVLPIEASGQPSDTRPKDQRLAREILANQDLPDVLARAKEIIKTGFNAGDGYGEVWIRDFATFIEFSCDVYDHAEIRNGFVEEAYREALPMIERVRKNDGFYEWYSVDNEPRGSGTFRGSAGVLGKAVEMLLAWAKQHDGP